MDVSSLLKSKNKCLEKFLELSSEFWDRAQTGDLSELVMFQTRREATLKAVDLYDRKINEIVSLMTSDKNSPALVAEVKAALERKDALVKQILELDFKIIAKIEDEKARLVRELSSSRKSQEIAAKFKSTWIAESGEELDKKL